jgi:hypothetical protein
MVFSLEINYTIKKFIFKADSINLASVEEVPILLKELSWDSHLRVIIKKSSYTLILKCLAALYFFAT